MTSAVSSIERGDDDAVEPSRRLPRSPTRYTLAFVGVLVGGAVLNLWGLAHNGYDGYLGAAALSASHSWKALFFGSLDAHSFVTIDKPPLALWLQGLSVRIIGFGAFAVLLPQVLCGIATTAVVHRAVRLAWGDVAALVAAAAFALTPIAVAMARSDHPDMVLTLMMALAAWGVISAVRTGRTAPLLWAAAAIGLGYLAKMSAAMLVLPALAATYLLTAPVELRRRLTRLASAAGVLVVVAGAWFAVVALTPASSRPYLGGSKDNGVFDLIWNYNGPGRLFGHIDKPESVLPPGTPVKVLGAPPGLGRLFAPDVAGQFGWLIPLAAVGLVAGLWLTRRAARTDLSRVSFIVWGGWAVVHFVAFSFDKSQWHSYYAVSMAPAIAALVGGGIVTLVRARERWSMPLLTLGIAGNLVWDVVLLRRTPHYLSWLAVTIGIVGAVAVVILVAAWRSHLAALLATGAIAVAVAGILAGPLAYDVTTVRGGEPKGLTQAGPLQKSVMPLIQYQSLPSILAKDQGFDPRMLAFLKQQRGSAKWLLAVPDGVTAGSLIISTGQPIMAMGGFRGTDPALSPERMARLVDRGELRFVLDMPLLGNIAPPPEVSRLDAWIKANCRAVGGGQQADPQAPALRDCRSH
jgi:4-amino-4-deoxy-L-arabinose transferase-like glycosyltransferase